MSSRSGTQSIEAGIAHLRGLDLVGLRARWRSVTGRAAPTHLPRQLLLRILAYRLQADALGDLDKASVRYLERLAGAPRGTDPAPLPDAGQVKPGTLLRREWEG